MKVVIVLGITDGISYVAKGVANEVGAKFTTVGKKRPQRAFTRSSGDSAVLILSNFDLGAARAQRFVLNNARKKKLKDTFICLASIDETSLLIFSDNYIFWVKEEEGSNSMTWLQVCGSWLTLRGFDMAKILPSGTKMNAAG